MTEPSARRVICVILALHMPVSISDLTRTMDQAIANGWEPVREVDAPPNAPGYYGADHLEHQTTTVGRID